jgi:hypothetical protein
MVCIVISVVQSTADESLGFVFTLGKNGTTLASPSRTLHASSIAISRASITTGSRPRP